MVSEDFGSMVERDGWGGIFDATMMDEVERDGISSRQEWDKLAWESYHVGTRENLDFKQGLCYIFGGDKMTFKSRCLNLISLYDRGRDILVLSRRVLLGYEIVL